LEVLRARAGSNAKEAPRVRIKQADFFEALERRGYEQKKDQGREANPRLEAAEYPKRDMLPGEWGSPISKKHILTIQNRHRRAGKLVTFELASSRVNIGFIDMRY
jgi:hypothetical protein